MATPLISLLCLHLAYSLPPPSGYSLNLNNEENVLSPQLRYEVLAALGTPAQSFSLLLDTALSVLVVNDAGQFCGALNSNDLMRAKVI